MQIEHGPDEEDAQARAMVDALHGVAARSHGALADLLGDAAAMLDGYRAGLSIATPHHCTGYALVRCPAASVVAERAA